MRTSATATVSGWRKKFNVRAAYGLPRSPQPGVKCTDGGDDGCPGAGDRATSRTVPAATEKLMLHCGEGAAVVDNSHCSHWSADASPSLPLFGVVHDSVKMVLPPRLATGCSKSSPLMIRIVAGWMRTAYSPTASTSTSVQDVEVGDESNRAFLLATGRYTNFAIEPEWHGNGGDVPCEKRNEAQAGQPSHIRGVVNCTRAAGSS